MYVWTIFHEMLDERSLALARSRVCEDRDAFLDESLRDVPHYTYQ